MFNLKSVVRIAVATLWLAGCSAVTTSNNAQRVPDLSNNQIQNLASVGGTMRAEHLELIVTDLVSAMVQVRELQPLLTTLQVSEPNGVFGKKLVATLEDVGYGLQTVTADRGVNYVAYANRLIESNAGNIQDFSIQVGGIEVRREYSVIEDKVIPGSFMFVKGTRSFDSILLNKTLFLQQDGELTFDSGVEVELQDSTVLSPQVSDIQQSEAQVTDRMEIAVALRLAKDSSSIEQSRSLLTRKSEFRPIQQAAIVFADTSLQIGRQNKSLVQQLLGNLDMSLDALFIASCSSDSDPPLQAELRSTRVKEELILYGVPPQLIAEEGCVASEYPQGVISSRAVLVMHRRNNKPVELLGTSLPASFPARPLAMTIPYTVGGATDYQARIVTMYSGDENMLGQPITIINKPGLGGRTGWSWFAETASDSGYDIATYNVPHFIAQSIKYPTSFNIDTLEPIANWGADPAVLIVPVNSRFKTLRDLIIYARKNPGKLSVSGAGEFVGHHIAMLQLQKAARITLDYKPALGGVEALQQVMGNQVISGFNNMSDVYRVGDKVRVLAIADLQRNSLMPEVPTFKELGVDIDDSSVNFRGILAPKGTPSNVIQALSESTLKMFRSPGVAERMQASGAPMRVMSREEVINMWRERYSYLAELLKGL